MWEQVFVYCERHMHTGFWAEPLNAVTNIAFLVAALMAYSDLRSREPRAGGKVILLLILLVMTIGAGSFLFHTLATRWAALTDVIPIAAFIFSYVALSLRWYFRLGVAASLAGGLLVGLAGNLMPPWFNGSFAYAPALLTLLIVGVLLKARDHAAAPWILSAGAVFVVSITFRTIDMGAGCFAFPPGAADPQFVIGTHPLWHILNGVTIYLLLRAAIENPPETDAR